MRMQMSIDACDVRCATLVRARSSYAIEACGNKSDKDVDTDDENDADIVSDSW